MSAPPRRPSKAAGGKATAKPRRVSTARRGAARPPPAGALAAEARPGGGGGGGGGTTRRRRAARASLSAPHISFDAHVRCAVRVGRSVWAAERDGCVVVRDVKTAAAQHRIMVGLHHLVWCLLPLRQQVWCGTERGGCLILDASSREVVAEARGHSGGVHCLAATERPLSEPRTERDFVLSGGADFTIVMWSDAGKLRRQYHGHAGAVRALLVLGMSIWSCSDDGSVRDAEASPNPNPNPTPTPTRPQPQPRP